MKNKNNDPLGGLLNDLDEELNHQLIAEMFKFFREENRERERERHDEAVNEALRRRGYWVALPRRRRYGR